MLKTLRRLFRPSHRRALEAASGGRRWENLAASDSLNAALFAGSATVRKRAAHYAVNNPWIARGIDAMVSNLVGCGIKPQSRHPNAGARAALHDLWDRWTEDADAGGVADLYGLQRLVARGLVQSGEAFIRLRTRRPGDGLAVPLQLQLLDPQQVDASLHRELPGGGYIRAGVEFNSIGRRVAYHVHRDRPGDPLAVSFTPTRIPAEEVIHVFTPIVPGQVRGLSALASVLLRLHELDQFEDATLVGQKVRALFAGFITDADGDAAGFQGSTSQSLLEHGMEPGTLRVLPPGADIKFSDPTKGGDGYDAFVKNQLRAIAAGIGVTYEQLTGDMTGVNYSSARVALIEFRRRIEALQEQVIVHQFCRPVWQRFVRLAVLSGALQASGFERDPKPWLSVKWVTPGWDWVDPLKDVQAERQAVDAGFKSRSEVIAARGWDPEQVDAEIAGDQARAERLGLQLGGADATPTMEAPNADND